MSKNRNHISPEREEMWTRRQTERVTDFTVTIKKQTTFFSQGECFGEHKRGFCSFEKNIHALKVQILA